MESIDDGNRKVRFCKRDLFLSTGFNSAEDSTPSSHIRVLKPPGGGTSDIFNSAVGSDPEPQRKVKNLQPSSKLFGEGDATDSPPPMTPPKTAQSNGVNGQSHHGNGENSSSTHWRLFGPPHPVTPSPSVKPPNQRLFGSGFNDGERRSKRRPPYPRANNHFSALAAYAETSFCVGLRHVKRRPDGNPVTGEGYEENGKNGSVSSRSSEAGSVGSFESGGNGPIANGNGTAGTSVRMSRGRVPPGGFSSGFW